MKKRLNMIVLVIEIAAISILHAVKLRQSDKENQFKGSISATHTSPFKQASTIKPPYILMKMIK